MSKEKELEKTRIVVDVQADEAETVIRDGTASGERVDESVSPVVSSDEEPVVLPDFGERYELLDKIGKGGMGSVYRVVDRQLGRTFAAKVLQPELAKDPVALKRFEQEVESASKLSHANLVAVYGHDRLPNGSPFLLMDALNGHSLSQEIKEQGAIPGAQALEIFLQIGHGLAHAHECGVVHRDIKPTNIILARAEDGETKEVKIVDFGIAKALPTANRETHNLTETGEVFGSPDYMSPEQCLGFMLDQTSDIYSFGCLMYETLTGKAPFAGANPIQLVIKHINEEAPEFSPELKKRDKVAEKLENIVLRCLEKDQSNRYQSVEELLKELETVRDGKQPAKYTRAKKEKPIFTTKAVLGLLVAVPIVFGYFLIGMVCASDASEMTMRIFMSLLGVGGLVGSYMLCSLALEKLRALQKWRIPERKGWLAIALGSLGIAILLLSSAPLNMGVFGFRLHKSLETIQFSFIYLHFLFAFAAVVGGVGFAFFFKRRDNVHAASIAVKFLLLAVAIPLVASIVAPRGVAKGIYALAQMPAGRLAEVSLPLMEVAARLDDNFDYFRDASFLAQELGKNDKSIQLMNQSIACDPKNAMLYSYRAELYKKLGMKKQELADLEHYMQLAGDPFGREKRAQYYYENGDLPKALSDFNILVQSSPSSIVGYKGRARIHYRMGDRTACIGDLTKLIDLSTNLTESMQYHMIRGILYDRLLKGTTLSTAESEKIRDEAADDFTKVIELSKMSLNMEVYRIAALKALGDVSRMNQEIDDNGDMSVSRNERLKALDEKLAENLDRVIDLSIGFSLADTSKN